MTANREEMIFYQKHNLAQLTLKSLGRINRIDRRLLLNTLVNKMLFNNRNNTYPVNL